MQLGNITDKVSTIKHRAESYFITNKWHHQQNTARVHLRKLIKPEGWSADIIPDDYTIYQPIPPNSNHPTNVTGVQQPTSAGTQPDQIIISSTNVIGTKTQLTNDDYRPTSTDISITNTAYVPEPPPDAPSIALYDPAMETLQIGGGRTLKPPPV